MPYWAIITLCGMALLIGAVIQGVIGLGVGLVSAPIFAFVAPSWVPVTLLICGVVLPALTTITERSDVDWKGLGWAFPFRFIGTAIGAWLVVVMSVQALNIVVGAVVLAAVAVSLVSWRPMPTPGALGVGAVISGIGATVTSIGGPPIALVYQNQSPARLRSTLGFYFLIGNIVSIATLAIVGQVQSEQLIAALWLTPFVVAGFGLAMAIRSRLVADKIRSGVLAVCGFAAIVLIIKSVF